MARLIEISAMNNRKGVEPKPRTFARELADHDRATHLALGDPSAEESADRAKDLGG